VPVPAGAELLLEQREKVNDAWDLPKEATMDPFVASHPQWKDGVAMKESFEWKWYYAFHQVGDESVKAVSDALRDGVAQPSRKNRPTSPSEVCELRKRFPCVIA